MSSDENETTMFAPRRRLSEDISSNLDASPPPDTAAMRHLRSVIRSRSLDRYRPAATVKILPPKLHTPKPITGAYSASAVMTTDGVLRPPAITITQHPGYSRDVMAPRYERLASPSCHSRSSSSASILSRQSFLTEDSNPSAGSSQSSSVRSSPASSPRLLHANKARIKIQRDRETKYAERQAADACNWLRAAGGFHNMHISTK
uniref:Uncharacterized protein n=2 Tax=Ciona savignyi TaxID=51511 RepID=H2YDY8_CIOSA